MVILLIGLIAGFFLGLGFQYTRNLNPDYQSQSMEYLTILGADLNKGIADMVQIQQDVMCSEYFGCDEFNQRADSLKNWYAMQFDYWIQRVQVYAKQRAGKQVKVIEEN